MFESRQRSDRRSEPFCACVCSYQLKAISSHWRTFYHCLFELIPFATKEENEKKKKTCFYFSICNDEIKWKKIEKNFVDAIDWFVKYATVWWNRSIVCWYSWKSTANVCSQSKTNFSLNDRFSLKLFIHCWIC